MTEPIKWVYENGEIVACIEGKLKYNLFAIMKNTHLHQLYHEEIKRSQNDKETNKR